MPFDWNADTRPFVTLDGGTPASFVLEQVDDAEFALEVPFRYAPPEREPIDVTAEALGGPTDLASIPQYMSWFVSRYGRHTPAALVHDQLVEPGMDPHLRARADLTLLEAMDHLEVPPVRSRVIWAAVALATRWHTRPWGTAGVAVWGVAAATGMGLLAFGLATGSAWAVVLALLGPLLSAVLWGSAFWAGVIAGYALPLVALPALASLLGYWSYWVIEQAVRVGRKLFPHNRDVPLAPPVKYREK